MQPFEYSNPVKVVFGDGVAKRLGEYASAFGKHALLVTYSESEFFGDLLDSLHRSLAENGVACTDYYGASANPTLRQARGGICLAKEVCADLIVGVGGGSAMDLAKVIAAGVLFEDDIAKMIAFSHSDSSQVVPEKALPFILIPTLPATGSEMNPTAVMTDEVTRRKSYVWAPDCLYAKIALMDPTLTVGLPAFQTACGAVDTIAHIAESYFNGDGIALAVQDKMQVGVIKAVLETLPIVLKNPSNTQSRGVMLWAASIALNGWLLSGTYTWAPMHQIGHVLSARYGATHGAALGTMIPAWLRFFALRKDNERYEKFSREIFGTGPEGAADQFCLLLQTAKMPTGISDFGVKKQDIPAIADEVVSVSFNSRGILASNPPLDREDVVKICELAL